MSFGYVYYRGTLHRIDGIHRKTIGDIDDAIAKGYVRIRDFGEKVAFQGRSKQLVNEALQLFLDDVRIPCIVAVEYPGIYEERNIR